MNTLALPAPRPARGPRGTLRALARVASLAGIALRIQRVPRDLAAATPPARRAARLQTACAALCERHGIRIRIRGPVPQGPAILVANHLGYLDPLVLAALVPCAPIAKREASGWPLIGRALGELGLIFVDRGRAESGASALRKARRVLDAGVSVLVFPEGTTTCGDRVLPFHRGAFGLARRLGVPVVPVALSMPDSGCCWVGDDGFLPHYLRFAARPGITVDVSFGAPLTVEEARVGAEASRRVVDALRCLAAS